MFPTVKDAAVTDPAPVMIPVAFAVGRLGSVMALLTDSKTPVLTLKVDPLPIITKRQAPLTSTVRVIPALIVTVSALVGTGSPPQVAISLQLPVTEAVLWANTGPLIKKDSSKITLKILLFINFTGVKFVFIGIRYLFFICFSILFKLVIG